MRRRRKPRKFFENFGACAVAPYKYQSAEPQCSFANALRSRRGDRSTRKQGTRELSREFPFNFSPVTDH
jgi:hypothetical protein